MHNRFSYIFLLIMLLSGSVSVVKAQEEVESEKPVILYTAGAPKKYEIADIQVEGIQNYEDYILIGISGLSVGQQITVPGDDVTNAIKRYWRHGFFSDVCITAEKIVDDKIWLKIALKQRPRISEIRYEGVKKSEREDLTARLGWTKGGQITPNQVDRAKTEIKRYFDDKGFKNAEVIINQKDDVTKDNQVFVDILVDKKEKIKVHSITFDGNTVLSDRKLKRVMKKTNEKGKIPYWFRPKKFVDELYQADKQLIIDKYNELGYRDAVILEDSVSQYDSKTVDVYIKVDEGQKYYLRDITWVGNTLYNTEQLNYMLQMKKGDVYNQKLLNERLNTDEDAVGNLYYNNGYLFYSLDPVEVNIDGDSIDLEMRIYEGRQATINKIIINGNTRVYENVVRREMYTRPGELFSREDLMRSARELQQMGHFDPEKIDIQPLPDPVNGTVDIAYNLTSKSSDQVEFSAGWGQTGVIGKLSLKFTNFSVANLFHPGDNYRGILPQGDGQTLTLSGETNARYYQQYSISFFDPWFGGKRPNSFSVSAFYSRQTDMSDHFYNKAAMNNLYNSMYNYGGYGYGYGYGYGGYGYGGYNNYENFLDPDKSIQIWGLSLGWGKRLNWPDDFFTLSAELAYQRYVLKDWEYFLVRNGKCNNISLNLNLGRSSIDNPIFPRRGSEFQLSAQITPPYSLFDKKDYKSFYDKDGRVKPESEADLYSWIEYHKWKFKGKMYLALMDYTVHKKCPVLMTRVEMGLLGHYNKYKKSPFEAFDVGGDGMPGYSNYASESIALRGYENNSLTQHASGYAYTRFTLELRYPLMLDTGTNIYVLGFLEGGNAWHDIKDFNPFEMKRSAGVGVRIFLPMIGLMGIDWAYGFDKVNGSKSYGGSHFHFILGQEF